MGTCCSSGHDAVPVINTHRKEESKSSVSGDHFAAHSSSTTTLTANTPDSSSSSVPREKASTAITKHYTRSPSDDSGHQETSPELDATAKPDDRTDTENTTKTLGLDLLRLVSDEEGDANPLAFETAADSGDGRRGAEHIPFDFTVSAISQIDPNCIDNDDNGVNSDRKSPSEEFPIKAFPVTLTAANVESNDNAQSATQPMNSGTKRTASNRSTYSAILEAVSPATRKHIEAQLASYPTTPVTPIPAAFSPDLVCS